MNFRNPLLPVTTVTFAFFLASCTDSYGIDIRKIAEVPAENHTGTAGAFIGSIGDTVIIAGGSDFPGPKPWEGGEKVYYDDIYILYRNGGNYECKVAEGKLPVPLGNGCAVSDGKTVFCIGGNNSARRSDAVYALRINNTKIIADSIACIPPGFVPCSASVHKGEIYVHGTDTDGNALYRFSYASGTWTELACCPDRKIQEGAPLIFLMKGNKPMLFLIGGRGTDKDGLYLSGSIWGYDIQENSWERRTEISTGGEASTLMYSSAVSYGSRYIMVAGGDDGKEFSRRLELDRKIRMSGNSRETERMKAELADANIYHAGFCDKIFSYDVLQDCWSEIGESGIPLPVVTSAICIGNSIIIPSGEIHPGVRSRDIIEIQLHR